MKTLISSTEDFVLIRENCVYEYNKHNKTL